MSLNNFKENCMCSVFIFVVDQILDFKFRSFVHCVPLKGGSSSSSLSTNSAMTPSQQVSTCSYKMFLLWLIFVLDNNKGRFVLAEGEDAKPNQMGADNMMLDMINLPNGQLKGQMVMSRAQRPYYSFSSIPYARQPRKFEPAEPPMSWNGVLDATKMAPLCPQTKYNAPNEVLGQEDCLYLTVHAPKEALRRRVLYPVVIFIHGGTFTTGCGDEYGAKYMMDEDIILVTFNYRLGALGFLSTGDGEILGNAGLKDQVLLLKWVQQNIVFFGGDRSRVTLLGSGSGAVSAQMHMLSPMSSGLFSNVIAHSGSVLVPFAIAKNPAGTAYKFGMKMGCNATNSRDLALCLKAKDAKDIVLAQAQFLDWDMDPFVPFSPTVEVVSTITGYVQPQGMTFLPEHPYQMILQGRFQRAPMLTGVNKDEGLLFHAETILANEKALGELNQEWNRVAPISLMYDETMPYQNQKDYVSQKIKGFYFGNKMIGPDTRMNLTNMYSDRYFVHGVQTAAFNFAKFSSVYPFHFSFMGSQSSLKSFGINDVKGVAHSDELQYFFDMSTMPLAAGSPEEKFSSKVIKLWVSFIYHGKPVDTWMSAREWLPIQPVETVGGVPSHYYDLNNMEFRPIESPFSNRMHFWNSLYDTDLASELTFIPYRNNKTAFHYGQHW